MYSFAMASQKRSVPGRASSKKSRGSSKKNPGGGAPTAPAVQAKAASPDLEAPPASPHATLGFPIVGIGGSAGALPAVQDLFLHMPADCGIAFVVVTHSDPKTPSLLPEILSRCTRMRVSEAESGQRIEANRVYVTPPGCGLVIRDGILWLERGKKDAPRIQLPIDAFFRSLAEDQRHWAVGIVLSGTGADGTLGLAAIRAESGLALAQDPASAEFNGMPASAIAAGAVDLVLATSEMPERLLSYVSMGHAPARRERAADSGGDDLDRVLEAVHRLTRRDFSAYKRGTLQRRVERRMNLHQIEHLREYVRLLEENPAEVEALWKDWLIG
ncbi:MAG TPA: chemotaxis protein CheB, partial [Deltaproteobacteria bacterium]|nr:chemotaxis protein CheB [Deltaproteobacteria bacterium]